MKHHTLTQTPLIARSLLTVLSLLTVTVAHPEAPLMIIPLAGYEHTALDKAKIANPVAGIVAQTEDGEIFQAVGLYGLRKIDADGIDDIPETVHSIDALVTGRLGRNRYLGVFKSSSDEPIVGGMATFKIGAAFGHDVIATDRCSLTLGGGVAIGDFGLEGPGGMDVCAIPVPFVRFRLERDFWALSFDFLTGPNLSFVIGTKSRVRLVGETRIDQLRDARDILFDAAVQYRLFGESSPMGDFASVALGFRNADAGIDRANGESVSIQYLAPYAKADFGIAQLTAGYAFAGRAITNGGETRAIGNGPFVGLQAMIPLGAN